MSDYMSIKEKWFYDSICSSVQDIRESVDDSEAAHSLEDDLRERVLREIADGDFGLATLYAKECLKTSDLDFSRWCA